MYHTWILVVNSILCEYQQHRTWWGRERERELRKEGIIRDCNGAWQCGSMCTYSMHKLLLVPLVGITYQSVSYLCMDTVVDCKAGLYGYSLRHGYSILSHFIPDEQDGSEFMMKFMTIACFCPYEGSR